MKRPKKLINEVFNQYRINTNVPAIKAHLVYLVIKFL